MDVRVQMHFPVPLFPKCAVFSTDDRICNDTNAQKNTPTDFLSTLRGILRGGDRDVCDVLSGYYGNTGEWGICQYLPEMDG